MPTFLPLRTIAALFSLAVLTVACGGGSGVRSPQAALPVASQTIANAEPKAEAEAGSEAVHFAAPMLPPHGTIYLGAYVAPVPDESPAAQITATGDFETSIGRKLGMNLHYHLWTDTLVGIGEQDDADNGRIPFVSWSCVSGFDAGVKDADIAAGLYDDAITKRAQAVKAFGHTIFLRYKWEMNLVHNAQCADPAHDVKDKHGKLHYSPTEYIAAWQHIRQIFTANNATNVVWVWNPSGNGVAPSAYYPGDLQVDWIGFDWYDTFNLYFDPIYTYSYDKKTGRNVWTYPYFASHYPTKPLMIGETGAVQKWQASYFTGDCCNKSAVKALQKSLKHIQAYVYWDSTGGRGNFQILDRGLPSFMSFANSHYMSGRAPGP